MTTRIKHYVAIVIIFTFIFNIFTSCLSIGVSGIGLEQSYIPLQWETIISEPSVGYVNQLSKGDFNGDSKDDFIISVGSSVSMGKDSLRYIFIIDSEGSLIKKIESDGYFIVDDVDDDGIDEIILCDIYNDDSEMFLSITVYKNNSILWYKEYEGDYWVGVPEIRDMDGDGIKELLFLRGHDQLDLLILSSSNGRVITSVREITDHVDYRAIGEKNIFVEDYGGNKSYIFISVRQNHRYNILCFSSDGTLYWNISHTRAQGQPLVFDVQDFDGDEEYETLILSTQTAFLVSHVGEIIWKKDIGVSVGYSNVLGKDYFTLHNYRGVFIVIPSTGEIYRSYFLDSTHGGIRQVTWVDINNNDIPEIFVNTDNGYAIIDVEKGIVKEDILGTWTWLYNGIDNNYVITDTDVFLIEHNHSLNRIASFEKINRGIVSNINNDLEEDILLDIGYLVLLSSEGNVIWEFGISRPAYKEINAFKLDEDDTIDVIFIREIDSYYDPSQIIFTNGNLSSSSPIIRVSSGDLDNDGLDELVVIKRKLGVWVYDYSGYLKWRSERKDFREILIGDVTGDGFKEIIATSRGPATVQVFNYQGDQLAKFPHYWDPPIIALAHNVDGSSTYIAVIEPWSRYNYSLRLFDYEGNFMVRGHLPSYIGARPRAFPEDLDIDDDNIPDIIIETKNDVISDPKVVYEDLNGDNIEEKITMHELKQPRNKIQFIRIYDSNDTLLNEIDIRGYYLDNRYLYFGDLNGDKIKEVILQDDSWIRIFYLKSDSYELLWEKKYIFPWLGGFPEPYARARLLVGQITASDKDQIILPSVEMNGVEIHALSFTFDVSRLHSGQEDEPEPEPEPEPEVEPDEPTKKGIPGLPYLALVFGFVIILMLYDRFHLRQRSKKIN